ncbi:Bug family tripartite tricarboxylate transporter substrate binding protein [Bordetella flabilis]|uniref:ABC transporter substrate-binding protein n=1 Tax=Bordetella flabilis TaxID=463014 RepID=A0A193GHM8_9BORD|nr:tripartite tricarboxylate transporter substrate binding protein [Bordetella flabilis]ANN79093.1 hypothetical protein BAU07_19980 [Bordetella flabilis]
MDRSFLRSALGWIVQASLAITLGTATHAALADSFPSQSVLLTVGYPAGGGADVAARQLSAPLQQLLGQTVVVENRGGASGSIATAYYLQQPQDGHRLLALTGNDAVMNPAVLKSAKYDPNELRLLHPLIFSDLVLVTGRKDAPENIDKLIAMIKAPGGPEYSFGNWGVGSTPHLASVDFQLQAGIKTLDVQYRGVTPIVQDLVGGQVDYAFLPIVSTVLDMIRAGRLKAVSMGTVSRNPSLPDVPGTGESTVLKDFNYQVWPGIFVHRNTPEPVARKLQESVAGVVNSAAYQKWSVDTGNRPMTPMDLAQADAFYRDELARAQRLTAKANLSRQ